MRWRVVGPAVVALGVVVAACDHPSVDGSKVPPGTPDCASVCARLVALCGYAPQNDACTDDAGAGYCDTQIAPDYLDCFASAPSCEDAWSCFDTVTVPGDDAAAEAGDGAPDDATAE